MGPSKRRTQKPSSATRKPPGLSAPERERALLFSGILQEHFHFRASSRFSISSPSHSLLRRRHGRQPVFFFSHHFQVSHSKLPLSPSLFLDSAFLWCVFVVFAQSFRQACADRTRLDSGWIWSDISWYQRYLDAK